MQGYACAARKWQAAARRRVSSAFFHLLSAHSPSSWCRTDRLPGTPSHPGNMSSHIIWSATWQPCLQDCSWRSRQSWSWGQTLAGRREIPSRETPCVSLRRELASMLFTPSHYCRLQFVSSEGQTACLQCACSCETTDLLYFSVCIYVCAAWIHCCAWRRTLASGNRIERSPQPVLWLTELETTTCNCLCFALKWSRS